MFAKEVEQWKQGRVQNQANLEQQKLAEKKAREARQKAIDDQSIAILKSAILNNRIGFGFGSLDSRIDLPGQPSKSVMQELEKDFDWEYELDNYDPTGTIYSIRLERKKL